MNLQALEYFREVVETKSISKVATNRHISQSALSQNINKLESEIGHQLLDRSNKGVEPTEAGRILFKYSGTMMRVYEKMMEELDHMANQHDSIRINGFLSLVDYSLPCVLYKVKKKYPSYQFEMHAKSNQASINELLDDLTDLCFVTESTCDERLAIETIGKETMILVANAQTRIPDKIVVNDLKKYDMVFLDDEAMSISSILKQQLKHTGITLDQIPILFKVDSIPAAKSSLNNGLGICFLPYMAVKKELYEKRFKLVEVEGLTLDYPIYLVGQKKSHRPKAVDDVFNYFVKHGEKEFC